MIQYRYYQIQLVQEILAAIEEGCRKILVVSSMGSGKSIMTGMLLSNLALSNHKNTLIAVPYSDLVTQMSATMSSFNLMPDITTYISALNYSSTDVLIFDEAQHVGSNTGKNIINCIDHKLLIGLTATPYRTDGCPLLSQNGGVFDKVITGPSIQELTDEGYLANIEYYSYPLEEITETKEEEIGGLSFITTYKYSVIPDKEEEIVDEYAANFPEMSTIVFTRTVDHAQNIAHKFNSSGIHADYLSCYRPKSENKKVLGLFKQGIIKVVAACNLASEGLDVPRVKLAILARTIKKAVGLQMQQIGRIIRPYQEEVAKVLDLVGNIHRIGEIAQLYNTIPIT